MKIKNLLIFFQKHVIIYCVLAVLVLLVVSCCFGGVYGYTHYLSNNGFFSSSRSDDLVYVIVADNIYNNAGENVQAALQQYKQDVESSMSFDVEIVVWDLIGPDIDNSTILRNFLFDAYKTLGLVGVVFVGDIPYVYSQYNGVGGIDKYCNDNYFNDLDGVWVDVDNNSWFDEYYGARSPEIWTGRIFASSISQGDILLEIDFVNNYFRKNHAYRTNDSSDDINNVSRRAALWASIPYGGIYEENLHVVFDDVLAVYIPNSTVANYTENMSNDGPGYELVRIGGHGAGVGFYNGKFGFDDIMAFDPKGIFYDLDSCAPAKFTYTTGGQAYIFAPTYGLAAIGTSGSSWVGVGQEFYYGLRQGWTVADAFMEEKRGFALTLPEFSLNILGDPLLFFSNETWIATHDIPNAPLSPTGGPDPGTGTPDMLYSFEVGPAWQNNLSFVIDWGDGHMKFGDFVDPDDGVISYEHSYDYPGWYNVTCRVTNVNRSYSRWSEPLLVYIGIPDFHADAVFFEIEAETTDSFPIEIENEGNTQLSYQLIDETLFDPAVEFDVEENFIIGYDSAVDSKGFMQFIHAHTADGIQYTLLHQQINPETMSISDPALLVNDTFTIEQPQIFIDEYDNRHIIWRSNNGSNGVIQYLTWNNTIEQWLSIETILTLENYAILDTPSFTIDKDGVVHVVVTKDNDIVYTNSSIWNSHQKLTVHTGTSSVKQPIILSDFDDALHVVFIEEVNMLYHLKKPINQPWSTPQLITFSPVEAVLEHKLVSNSESTLFSLVLADTDDSDSYYNVFYQVYDPVGETWRSDGRFPSFTVDDDAFGYPSGWIDLKCDQRDILHLIWYNTNIYTGGTTLYYKSWDKTTNPYIQKLFVSDKTTDSLSTAKPAQMSIDSLNNVHLLWYGPNAICYKHKMLPLKNWMDVQATSGTCSPGETSIHTVIINASRLTYGEYQGYIIILSNDFDESVVHLPVTLTVHSTTPAGPEKLFSLQGGTYNQLYWLSVTTNDDGLPLTDLYSYIVYRNSSGSTTIFEQIGTTDNLTTSYFDYLINQGTIYCYQVSAKDTAGYESVKTLSQNITFGDANADGAVNVGDAVFLINYVFKGGLEPIPLFAGDANGDCQVNVGDAVYIINYVFKGGPPPVETCCWC